MANSRRAEQSAKTPIRSIPSMRSGLSNRKPTQSACGAKAGAVVTQLSTASALLLRAVQNGGAGRPNLVALGW